MAAEDITPEVEDVEGAGSGDADEAGDEPDRERRSKADRAADLIDALIEKGELEFILSSVDETPHARIHVDGRRELHRLRGGPFGRYIRRRFHEAEDKVLVGEAFSAALAHADMRAWDAPRQEIYVRVAPGPDGSVLVDLCNEEWQQVRVTPYRTYVEPHTVNFARGPLMLPLPFPLEKPRSLLELLGTSGDTPRATRSSLRHRS
jgi:hypothetical protein